MTREEAIKELEFHLERQDLYDDIFLDACRLAIKALQERPKGRWKKPSPMSEPICSHCGRPPKTLFGILPPFCPNCGADMKEEQE